MLLRHCVASTKPKFGLDRSQGSVSIGEGEGELGRRVIAGQGAARIAWRRT
jgi:hypothetical protein